MSVSVDNFGRSADDHSMSSRRTLFLPGILSRASEHFGPISSLFPGEHIGFDDDGPYYDHEQMLEMAMRELVIACLDLEQKITIVGSSIGGMKIPFIVERFRQAFPLTSLDFIEKIVIIDAPMGVESMKLVPNILHRFVASRAGLLISPFSKIVVGPKDEEISFPRPEIRAQYTGDWNVTEDGWRAFVKKRATQQLKGYKMRLWWSWISWMITVGRDGSLARACRSLEGIDTTYIACVHKGNETVVQPMALWWWQEQVEHLKTIEIKTVHCAYLQQQYEFEQVLTKELNLVK